MIERSRAWIVLTVLLAACGTARDTSETASLAPSLGLTEMVLLWRTDGFDPGDTVYVNLSEISEAGTVSYYANGDPAGVSPDMAKEVADRLGVPVKYICYKSPGLLADAVDANEWDTGNIGAEPQRAEKIAFSASRCIENNPSTPLPADGDPSGF